MKRTLRILLTLLAVPSLILCAAACALWALSYRAGLYVGYSHSDPSGARATDWGLHATSARGRVVFAHLRDEYTDPAVIAAQARARYRSRWHWNVDRRQPVQRPLDDLPAVLGVGFRVRRNVSPGHTNVNRAVALPHPVLVVLTGAAPAAWFVGARRRRRRKRSEAAGLCVACGYNLRASPERCPECGRANGRIFKAGISANGVLKGP